MTAIKASPKDYSRTARRPQLQNASLMALLIPYVTEVPDNTEIDHQVAPSPLNPLTVKGAGEAGVISGSEAIASVIEGAEGFVITAVLILPTELFELRRQQAKEQSA